MRWLSALLLLAACKKTAPPTPDAAPPPPAEATQQAAPPSEPSDNGTPLYDAAPPPPEAPEARKLVAPVYEWTRTCFKENPATTDEKGPFEVRFTALPNGRIGQVAVAGRSSATECVETAIRQKLRLRPWTGSAMEIRLPVTATGDPIYIDGGSAPR